MVLERVGICQPEPANDYTTLNDTSNAVKAFRVYSESHPENLELHLELKAAEDFPAKFPHAKIAYERHLAEFLYLSGRIGLRMDNYSKSITHFDKVIRSNSGNLEARYYRAKA